MTHPMVLGLFVMLPGHHIAAWRHPEADPGAASDIDAFAAVAGRAEQAGFELMFVEDAAGLREDNTAIASQAARSSGLEPLTLLAALARRTARIGLVATASTSYNEPEWLAEAFASIDRLSGGRAGWNLVTSASTIEAANFGATGLKPHGDRYARARAFADVVLRRWTEAEASPQGGPVMVQAGASGPGRDLAAATADIVFSAAQTLDEAKAFYDDVKGRLAAHGRASDDLKILPGVSPVVGRTRAEAEAKYEALQRLIPDDVGVALLASYLSLEDLAAHPLDGPLPDMPATQGIQSRQQLVIDRARRENLSIRESARRFAGARGHWQVIGTPQDIADALEERFVGGACDGFNVMPPLFPSGLEDFVTLVMPELNRRGLLRNTPLGPTLRGNLGLPPLSSSAGRRRYGS